MTAWRALVAGALAALLLGVPFAHAEPAVAEAIPTTSITCNGGSCADWFQGPVSVALSADDLLSVISYTTDGSDPTIGGLTYTGPFTVSSTATVRFFATNLEGAEAVQSQEIRIDSEPPATTITCNGSPCAGPYVAPVMIALSATDNAGGSGVREIRYTTDGTQPNGKTLYTQPFPIDATTTVTYRALDVAGNAEGNQSTTIEIQAPSPPPPTPPPPPPPSPVGAPSVGSGPPHVTNSTSASFVFSDVAGATGYVCQLDGGPAEACTSPTKTYTGLADGRHTFTVRAVSNGVQSDASAPWTWTVDTVAPETTITSGPEQSAATASATFAFSSNETAPTFECRLDGGAFDPCTSPRSYSRLGQGPHTFEVRAVDAAGNTDPTPVTYSWTITVAVAQDRKPPARVSRLKAIVRYGSVRLTWRRPRDPDFDHVAVFGSTSARGPLRASVYSGAGTAFTNKRFQNGTYYRFAVLSYDRSGNGSRPARIAISPSALFLSPRHGSVAKRPPLLAWKPVRGATFYNVQLYRHGHKILSAWPKRAKLQLRRTWTYERAQRLTRSAYQWYVWPAFGPGTAARYGQLLGTGGFGIR